MRYQFKGIAGKWNVYDEAGMRVGSVRRSMGRKLEYQYGMKRQTFRIRRKGNLVWLEQDGIVFLSGDFQYPVDERGKPVQKSMFCPPMPEELKLEGEGEVWTLHQQANRNIEICHDGIQVGLLKGLVCGTKTLDWNGDDGLFEIGLLFFGLGVYMAEDDTVYAV